MSAKHIPLAGEPQRGWLRPPRGMTAEAIVALARAADTLCRAALVQEARLRRTLPGALDDALGQAAAAYRAAAARAEAELGGR